MSEAFPSSWRVHTYQPEHDSTTWEEIRGLLADDSPLGRGLRRVAATRVPMLLSGAQGRGKRWTARAAHALAGRTGPLIEVDKGERTVSGERSLPGLLEAAAHGTLVCVGLDRIPDRAQRELADLLDRSGTTSFVGLAENEPDAAVVAGSLRRDLADRLLWLEVEPLRRRRMDVETGLAVFLARESRRAGRPAPPLHDVISARLRGYPWPGDLSELALFARRAVALGSFEDAFVMSAPDRTLEPSESELWDSVCRSLREGRSVPLERVRRRLVRQAEKAWMNRVLQRVHGDPHRAAEVLGVSPASLTGLAGGRR